MLSKSQPRDKDKWNKQPRNDSPALEKISVEIRRGERGFVPAGSVSSPNHETQLIVIGLIDNDAVRLRLETLVPRYGKRQPFCKRLEPIGPNRIWQMCDYTRGLTMNHTPIVHRPESGEAPVWSYLSRSWLQLTKE
jgi:hypothetical protein